MQQHLDPCDTCTTSYQLSYNATKSFSLCFEPNQIKITPPSFVLGKNVALAVDKCIWVSLSVKHMIAI